MAKEKLNMFEIERFRKEINMYNQINNHAPHPHVAKVYAAHETPTKL